MRKLIYAFVFLAAFAVAGSASAAVNLEEFGFTVNGQSSDEVRAGSSYKIGFTADVDGGDDIDSFRVRHYNQNGDIVNTKCVTVHPVLGSGNDVQILRNVPTMSDMPAAEFDQEVHTFGIAGLGTGLPCDEDNQHPDSLYMENRLIITHQSNLDDGDTSVGGGSSTGTSTGSDPLAELEAKVNALVAQVSGLAGVLQTFVNNPPVASKPCPPTYTGFNRVTVQDWLIAHGYAARFAAVGVYSGADANIWGPVSERAWSDASMGCSR